MVPTTFELVLWWHLKLGTLQGWKRMRQSEQPSQPNMASAATSQARVSYLHLQFGLWFYFVYENNILNCVKQIKLLFMIQMKISSDIHIEVSVLVVWRSAIMCLIILWGVKQACYYQVNVKGGPGTFLNQFPDD